LEKFDVGQTFLFAVPKGKQECLPHEMCGNPSRPARLGR
jgi:hypothetical protein